MDIKSLLFTEKYRPTNLDELVVPEFVKRKLTEGVVQNMLFVGSPGTGKTSTAKVLVKQFNHPYIYINASKDTGVDILRNRIVEFASTISMTGDRNKIKVVILDEIDGASPQFFKAFKASMEEFHESVRFIATSNYVNKIRKIDEAVLSRFDGGIITFDFDKEYETELIKGYIKRAYEICTAESIPMTKEAIVKLVQNKYPDFRSILNTLQSYKVENREKIDVIDLEKFSSVFKDVFDLIYTNIKPEKNYEFLLSNYSNRVDDVMSALGNEFIEYIKTTKPESLSKIPSIIICVAKYQAMRSLVIDQVLPMLACVYELQEIIREK